MTAALVGRERERRRLREARLDPEIAAIVLRGPAGAGKSALAEAALTEAAAGGALTGAGKYAEGELGSAFAPIVAALAQVASAAIDQLYDPTAGLTSLAAALGDGGGPLIEAGFQVGGLAAPDAADVAGRRESAARLGGAALRLIDWLTGFGAPVVLVIDDWRRGGPEALRLVRAVIARAPESQLTLLLTERDDATALSLPGSALIEVGQLSGAAAAELLALELGAPGAASAVMEWLGAHAPRLPFDVIEAGRRIRETGALAADRSGWAVDAERLAMADLPGAARSVASRIRRESAAAWRLASALAVCGDRAASSVLAAALDEPAEAVVEAGGELAAAGLAIRDGDHLQFRHDRLRVAVLESLGAGGRMRLAGEIAAGLSPGFGERPQSARLLALRLRLEAGLEGADPEEWRERFARGAVQARAGADVSAASAFAEAAWRLRERQPPSDPEVDRLILGEAVFAAADRKDAVAVMLRARALIAHANDPASLAYAYEVGVVGLRLADDFAAGWALACEGLSKLGLPMQVAPGKAAFATAALRWRLARRRRSREASTPAAAGPPSRFVRVAHTAAMVAFELNPALAALTALRGLERLSSEERRGAYWLAVQTFLSAVTGDIAGAARLGEQALAAVDDDGFGRSATLYRALYWGLIWRRPQAELRRRTAEITQLAIAEGDLVQAATAIRNGVVLGWRTCATLAEVRRDVEAARRELEWIGEPTAQTQTDEYLRVVDLLQGAGPLRCPDHQQTLAATADVGGFAKVLLRVELAALSGEWGKAAALIAALRPLKASFDSHPGGVIWRFHESICRLKTGRAALRADLRYVRRAAALNPADHRHKALILSAERLRARGDPAALSAYAVALEAAEAGPSRLEAGLAAELAAEAAQAFGRPEVAARHRARAAQIWSAWGARCKLAGAAPVATAAPTAQLAAAQAEAAAAQRADRAKSRLLADVAHELRTPLQGMQGLLDLAADNPAGLDVRSFRQVFGSLRSVVDDLIEFGALASGGVRLASGPVSIRELCDSELQIAAGLPGLDDDEIELQIAPGLPEWLATDGARVRQVVRNLLSNAAKYGEGGPVRVSVGGAPEADGRLLVSIAVEDSGPGLGPGDALMIFEPFERGERQGDGRGLGLGLALCRRIAEALDGALTAENRAEGGARFTFSFRAGAASAPPAPEAPLDGLSILVAEDSRFNRELTAALLRREARSVVEAADGDATLAALANRRFDVMILDLLMPGRSGLEVLRAAAAPDLASHRPSVIIVVTASSDPALTGEALTAGADAVLRKPVAAADLRAALAAALPRSEPRGAEVPHSDELRRIASAAAGELRRRANALSADFGALGLPEVASEAHRIAGLAAQFGWPAAASAADALECAARTDSPSARALVEALAACVETERCAPHSAIETAAAG